MPAGAYEPLTLVVSDLACNRSGRAVFASVSFRLGSGRLLAVSGPNGAGKSSLLRLLAGLLRPEAGTIVFEGHDEDAAVTHYLGHADALKPALTLRETLRFWGAIYARDGDAQSAATVDEAAVATGVGNALDLPIGVLSAGQRRRAGLARLLLSPRPLWLLDEPASALDRDGGVLLGRLMADHLAQGGLIVAATHQALPVEADDTLNLDLAQ